MWPRRQEAENEPDALYRPKQGEDVEFIGVSHAWECMEHPDPCGFQLAQLVDSMPDFDSPELFFIDYMCLYQFKRSEQGRSHVLCAVRVF